MNFLLFTLPYMAENIHKIYAVVAGIYIYVHKYMYIYYIYSNNNTHNDDDAKF